MIVVFVVVLVVFGPQKLPEIMAEFRKASTDFKSAFEEEMREMERQALQAERKKAAEAAAAAVAAEPSQPATLASPGDTESPVSDVNASAAEAPVISPVAESVPRSLEDAAETSAETAAVTNSQDPPHDTQTPA
jgi:TatA/E family protein of Tat protein translocase